MGWLGLQRGHSRAEQAEGRQPRVGSGQMRDNDRRGTAVKGKMKRKESWGQLSEHEVSHSLARGRKWKEVGRPACLNEHPGQVELLPCLPRLS